MEDAEEARSISSFVAMVLCHVDKRARAGPGEVRVCGCMSFFFDCMALLDRTFITHRRE